jgi:hypothetical protein
MVLRAAVAVEETVDTVGSYKQIYLSRQVQHFTSTLEALVNLVDLTAVDTQTMDATAEERLTSAQAREI